MLASRQVRVFKALKFFSTRSLSKIFTFNQPGIYGWGDGTEGQLGLGDNQSYKLPTLISSLSHSPGKLIRASDSYSIVLLQNNQLYGFGQSTDGQLTTKDNQPTPKLISTDICTSSIVSISCGRFHSLILTGLFVCLFV
jgi:alpha-tubulin suppressor-like RCC1 family protein